MHKSCLKKFWKDTLGKIQQLTKKAKCSIYEHSKNGQNIALLKNNLKIVCIIYLEIIPDVEMEFIILLEIKLITKFLY